MEAVRQEFVQLSYGPVGAARVLRFGRLSRSPLVSCVITLSSL